jgi:hypothetical protein
MPREEFHKKLAVIYGTVPRITPYPKTLLACKTLLSERKKPQTLPIKGNVCGASAPNLV